MAELIRRWSSLRHRSLDVTTTTAARRLDQKPIAHREFERADSRKHIDLAAVPENSRLAAPSRHSRMKPVGRLKTMLREKRARERGQRREHSPNPVASVMHTLPARASADFKSFQPDRITMLEHFRVRQAGIGHVTVNGIASAKTVARPGAAANGFVVPESLVSEKQVVHGSLAAGHDLEGFQQRIDDPLAGFRVPDRHGGIVGPWGPTTAINKLQNHKAI